MNPIRLGLLDRELTRRAMFRSALLGAGVMGLPQWLLCHAQAASTSKTKKRSLILLWQDGGASHFETFDPKPDAPSEYRGELDAIATTLPGIAYCEVLPRLAGLAQRTSVIRSLHQPSSDHVVGSHNVLTGWEGQTTGSKSRYPDIAAVISRMRSGAEESELTIGASTDPRLARGMRGPGSRSDARRGHDDLPRYVDLGGGLHRGGPAFLGPMSGPFQIAGDPSKPGFAVQNLQSLGSANRLHERRQMLRQLERLGQTSGAPPAGFEPLVAWDGFRRQAFDLLSGGGAARAFDLSREKPTVRDRYGRHLAGQQCLLARRLVEAGIGIVAVRFSPDGRGDYDKTMIGWDDHAVHGNIFEIMRKRGPQFDQSLSALIEDLQQRGMQDEVLVVVVGEFGRTPRIHNHKGCPGREHWGPAGCALLYGGGLEMGQVVGSTNDKGEAPQDRPLTYHDLLATIYHSMGIDFQHMLINHAGRPVPILPTGEPIVELTGGSHRVNEPDPARADSPPLARLDRSPQPASILSEDDSRGTPPSVLLADQHAVTLPAGATNGDLARLGNSPTLQSLVVRDSAIDDQGLSYLAECRGLRRLQLNGASVTDEGLRHLSHLVALEELNLTGTRVTNAGLAHLRPLVRLNTMSFDGTSISLAGVVRLFVQDQQRSLIDALAALGLVHVDPLGQVTAIDVAGTSFSDEESQYLEPCATLKELHLAATSITDAAMAHVAGLSQLERLYLAKCAVTDAGLAHVVGLSQLRAINLYGTQITSAGLEHLSGLAQLRLLSITDLKLSPVAVDRLKKQIPGLTVTDYTPV